MSQNEIKNETLHRYPFLKDMYKDSYFPNFLVDKCKAVLVNLCLQIETTTPTSLEALYKLTHAATNQFNDLEEEFWENESEIETGAREAIGGDVYHIAKTYGFEADREELISTRNW